jgi:hypothetical protein
MMKMKNKISILLLSLITVFAFTACEDEQEPFEGPYRLTVSGPGSATPETTATFTLGDIINPDSYTWSIVEGPGQIVGGANGATVEVEFLSVGDVLLNVTNGTDARTLTIHVEPVAPAVTGALSKRGYTAVRSGESDTVYFNFDSPVASIGSVEIASDSSQFNANNPFISGSLGDLESVDGSSTSYYAIYTGGEGNGVPEAKFTNIITTEAFGGDTVKSAYVQLYRVDNIDPIADISYSPSIANDSTEVTITVNFSEAVTFADPADSAIYISLSGAGVAAETDTLMPTEDPAVYTYTYTVNGEGEGNVSVELSNIQDLAGNEVALVRNDEGLTIDNTNPEITLTLAEDDGDYATITIVASESGTGMYVIVEDGEDAPDAPTTPEEFMEISGVASASLGVGRGLSSEVEILETGDYTVYYLVMDRAGNYSDVTSTNLVMD